MQNSFDYGRILLTIFSKFTLTTVLVGNKNVKTSKVTLNVTLYISDVSEPSWLEPGLVTRAEQFSAWLVTFSIQLGNFPIKARKLA